MQIPLDMGGGNGSKLISCYESGKKITIFLPQMPG